MRSSVKRVRALLESGSQDEAKQALDVAIKSLDTAAIKGVMHRRTASRTISRLTIAVKKLQTSA